MRHRARGLFPAALPQACATWLMLAAMAPVHAQTAAETEFFESRIRPLFAEKCQSCHGPEQSMGGLDFSPAGGLVRKPSPDHAAEPIVSRSDPGNSPLLRAVRYQGKIKMPPTGKLAGHEIADLTRWVKMGAPWPKQRPLAARSQPLRRSEFTEEERGFWAFSLFRLTRRLRFAIRSGFEPRSTISCWRGSRPRASSPPRPSAG